MDENVTTVLTNKKHIIIFNKQSGRNNKKMQHRKETKKRSW